MAGMHSTQVFGSTVRALAMFHRIDVLVNNATIGWPSGSPAKKMAQCFQTNSTGPLLMVEASAPLLKKSKSMPRTTNITSSGGLVARRLDPSAHGNRLGM